MVSASCTFWYSGWSAISQHHLREITCFFSKLESFDQSKISNPILINLNKQDLVIRKKIGEFSISTNLLFNRILNRVFQNTYYKLIGHVGIDKYSVGICCLGLVFEIQIYINSLFYFKTSFYSYFSISYTSYKLVKRILKHSVYGKLVVIFLRFEASFKWKMFSYQPVITQYWTLGHLGAKRLWNKWTSFLTIETHVYTRQT